jgi:hypothetical protein
MVVFSTMLLMILFLAPTPPIAIDEGAEMTSGGDCRAAWRDPLRSVKHGSCFVCMG